MNRQRARRADGTVLSTTDLAAAVPMMVDELHDIAILIDLIEQWLRTEVYARLQLSEYLIKADQVTTIWDIINALGATSVKLNQLARRGNTMAPVWPD